MSPSWSSVLLLALLGWSWVCYTHLDSDTSYAHCMISSTKSKDEKWHTFDWTVSFRQGRISALLLLSPVCEPVLIEVHPMFPSSLLKVKHIVSLLKWSILYADYTQINYHYPINTMQLWQDAEGTNPPNGKEWHEVATVGRRGCTTKKVVTSNNGLPSASWITCHIVLVQLCHSKFK